jgi:hypothetical protein
MLGHTMRVYVADCTLRERNPFDVVEKAIRTQWGKYPINGLTIECWDIPGFTVFSVSITVID